MKLIEIRLYKLKYVVMDTMVVNGYDGLNGYNGLNGDNRC
jgi:hypothetical protein